MLFVVTISGRIDAEEILATPRGRKIKRGDERRGRGGESVKNKKKRR